MFYFQSGESEQPNTALTLSLSSTAVEGPTKSNNQSTDAGNSRPSEAARTSTAGERSIGDGATVDEIDE